MFAGASALTSLDVNGWNTGNVTNMSWMFHSTSNVTNTGSLFSLMTSLREFVIGSNFALRIASPSPELPPVSTTGGYTGFWVKITEGANFGDTFTSAQMMNNLFTPGTWVWQRASHTVTYQSGVGTGTDHVISDLLTGSSHTVLTPTAVGFTPPTGHVFAGWTIGNNNAPATLNITGNVTLVANWLPNSHTITYQPGLGSGANHVINTTFGTTHNVLTSAPSGFTAPPGHVFAGWTIGVNNAPATLNITGNVTLVARWAPRTDITGTVNFFLQGTTTPVSPSLTRAGLTFGQSWTENAPTVSGHTLVGANSQTITLGTSENVITFFFTADQTPPPPATTSASTRQQQRRWHTTSSAATTTTNTATTSNSTTSGSPNRSATTGQWKRW